MRTVKDFAILLPYDVLSIKDQLLFVANEINAIVTVDRKTGAQRIWGGLPEEPLFSSLLVSRIISWRNKIVFVPMNAKKIWIYDTDGGTWEGLPIQNPSLKGKFFQAVLHGERLYLIGCRYPSIVCLNLETNSLQYLNGVMKEIDRASHGRGIHYFRNSYVKKGEQLYMPSHKSDYLLELNLSTQKYRLIQMGEGHLSYAGIAWSRESFWLFPSAGDTFFIWDGEGNAIKKPLILEDRFSRQIRGIAAYGDDIYILCEGRTFCLKECDWKDPVPASDDYFFFIEGRSLSYGGKYTERDPAGGEGSWDIRIERQKLIDFLLLEAKARKEEIFLNESSAIGQKEFLSVVEASGR